MLITTIFFFLHIALHKKWSFPLRISSVTFTEEIHIGKLYFLCSVAYNLRRRYFNQRSYFIQNKFKTLPVYSHAFIEFIVRPIQLCIWPKYFLFSSISIRSFFDLVFLAFLHWLFPWRPDILQHGPNKGKKLLSCSVSSSSSLLSFLFSFVKKLFCFPCYYHERLQFFNKLSKCTLSSELVNY